VLNLLRQFVAQFLDLLAQPAADPVVGRRESHLGRHARRDERSGIAEATGVASGNCSKTSAVLAGST